MCRRDLRGLRAPRPSGSTAGRGMLRFRPGACPPAPGARRGMSTIVVSGPIANRPRNGGLAWVVLSYALGLRRFGFDVHIIEEIDSRTCTDSGETPSTLEDSINLRFFTSVLKLFELSGTLVVDGGARTA